jgi:hypothetical protein
MTFDEWFSSPRSDRFYDDLITYLLDGIDEALFVKWLEAAYDVGYKHRLYETLDDGK